MRTSRRIILALMLGAAPVAGPGFAFDGAPVKPDAPLPGITQPAAQALNAQALKKRPFRRRPLRPRLLPRDRALAELAAIRRRRRPSRGAVEARPDVCQRRRRHPGRPARLRIFQPHRQRACRGQPVGAAGDDRRQRLRGAGPLLPQRHSQFQDQGRHRAGAGDVLLCRVLFRQCRRAVRSGAALSEDAGRFAGRFPLRRALARPRRPEGPASGAGDARPDAVQRRPAAAAARPRPDVADAGARQRRARRGLDQGKLQPGDRQGVRRRPRHGAADARALGAGPARTDGTHPVGSVWARCACRPALTLHAVSRSKSAQTGTWSDGFSQART